MELFYTDINGIAARYEEAVSRVSDFHRARIETCGDCKKRQGRLAAALLVQNRLGAEAAQQVKYTDAGKPYLPGGAHFSLSYGGNIAVLLVDQGECGVDTESLDGTGRQEPVAVLMDDELQWLQDQVHNYMTLWTRKEAALKAYGDMNAAEPASFSALEHSNSIAINGKRVYIGSYSAGGNVISWAAEKIGIPALTYLSADELLK